MKKTLLVCIPVLACAVALQAATITFVTPAGSTTSGGAVNDSATFTTGAGTLSVTLNDLEANPTDVAQLLSDLDFVLSTGQTTGTLSSSSGQAIDVNSGGTFTLGSTVSTGWVLNNNISGGLQLDVLGAPPTTPAHLIIGPPGTGGTYSNANGSIAGNDPHNPFLNDSATFNLSIAGVTAATTITSATFSYGTTAGINIVGVPQTPGVPEPATYAMLGSGLLALGIFGRRIRKA